MTSEPSKHNLITTDRVTGTPVFNLDGERIGHVDNLSIDKVSGHVRYALLSFGGFLGIGERFHPLPWAVLTYDPGQGGFVAPLDKTQLQILRAGTYELLARPDVPTKTVIGEYIDVAHAFFAAREAKFVNGVLDAVAKAVR